MTSRSVVVSGMDTIVVVLSAAVRRPLCADSPGGVPQEYPKALFESRA
jgi:hypothetical protein